MDIETIKENIRKIYPSARHIEVKQITVYDAVFSTVIVVGMKNGDLISESFKFFDDVLTHVNGIDIKTINAMQKVMEEE